MATITRDQMREALNAAGLEDASVRRYSGRYMYGSDCLAVVFDTDIAMSAIALGIAFGALMEHHIDDNDWEDFVYWVQSDEAASGARTDSMGLGTVVYWPSDELAGDDEDDEDDDV